MQFVAPPIDNRLGRGISRARSEASLRAGPAIPPGRRVCMVRDAANGGAGATGDSWAVACRIRGVTCRRVPAVPDRMRGLQAVFRPCG